MRSVLLTGEGRAFCSGGDVEDIIGELFARDMQGLVAFTRVTGALIAQPAQAAPPRRRRGQRRGRRRGRRDGARVRLPDREREGEVRLHLPEGRALRRRHGRGVPPAARRRPRPRERAALHSATSSAPRRPTASVSSPRSSRHDAVRRRGAHAGRAARVGPGLRARDDQADARERAHDDARQPPSRPRRRRRPSACSTPISVPRTTRGRRSVPSSSRASAVSVPATSREERRRPRFRRVASRPSLGASHAELSRRARRAPRRCISLDEHDARATAVERLRGARRSSRSSCRPKHGGRAFEGSAEERRQRARALPRARGPRLRVAARGLHLRGAGPRLAAPRARRPTRRGARELLARGRARRARVRLRADRARGRQRRRLDADDRASATATASSSTATKVFISNAGIANHYVVFANAIAGAEKRISAFLVAARTPRAFASSRSRCRSSTRSAASPSRGAASPATRSSVRSGRGCASRSARSTCSVPRSAPRRAAWRAARSTRRAPA